MKFSKLLATLKPYVAGEQPKDKKYIKLNTNENAYPPSPGTADVLKNFDTSELRLYPDPDASELKAALAKRHGVLPQNIFTGNGSDEVLGFCFPAFFDRKDCCGDTKGENKTPPVLFPDVTYSFYPVYANLYEIPYQTIPLKDDYTIDPKDYKNRDCQGIIIANPNAPTGIALKPYALEEIIAANRDKVVIIDEAYVDFCSYSLISAIKRYDNLLIIRTFSKSYSLAGARCGYAVGQKPLIDALDTVKNSFNSYTLDRITQKIALVSCNDGGYYDMINERIINIRDDTAQKLRKEGFSVLNSSANFIFIKKTGVSGERLYTALREKGILTRYFDGARTRDFVRVTIGTEEEMRIFLQKIKEIVKEV
ncbi:MAG: aminotransferase class I/II-fold pyridoxal phosphate-dependent enzyme [Clostridiales bacterium]|jgi:histidinol-phosphate aminotransferase|nr:aminotransferase class I/II-fold pyridoxal phosphate-dependent enzyme [Clostridiales bacterium]